MPVWMNALAGLAALAAAMGIGRFAFTPVLPMMQEDFGLPVAQLGWLATANYLGYLAGALSAIRLRIPPAIAIRAGLLAIGLTTLAMGFELPFLLWAALRFLSGIASAWVLVFVSTWSLERLAALGRPDLSGIVYAGVGAGSVVAGGVCLATTHATAAWLVLGVLSMLAAAVVWPFVATGAIRSAPVPCPQPIHWNAGYWRLVLCYGIFGFGYIIPATFLPAMAKAIIPDPQLFGWAWPVFGAAAAASTIFAARLKRLLSDRAIWIGGHLLMALGVVIPLFVPGLAGILVAALLVGGTFMVVTMAGMQEARSAGGANGRALMAAMTSAFAAGQILGPVIVSVLAPLAGGYAPALCLAAALLVLSALSLWRTRENT